MGVFKDFYRVSEANDYFINMSIPIMQEKILNLKNSIHEENLEKFIPGIKDHLSFQLRKIKNEIENAEKLIEKFIPGIKDHLSFQLRKIKNEIENAEKEYEVSLRPLNFDEYIGQEKINKI